MKPDARDLVGIAGLGLLGTGVWLVYPPAALIVVGSALLALALVGACRGRGPRRRPID